MFDTAQNRTSSEITIDDVALAAGVSIRTVSRVLNKSTKVSEETRARVEAVVSELKYRPSWRARGLATGRSYLLGLVHNEHNALVLGEVLRGAVQEAARRGYEIIVHPITTDGKDPVEEVVDFVERSRVDGVLLLAPASGIEGMAAALAKVKVATCALSAAALEGYGATLLYDERGGAAQAAQHLIDLGHRRIALLSGPDLLSARERRAGFLETLRAAGLEPVGEAQGDYGYESGVEGAKVLLALDPRPTAIFSASDAMAAGVLQVAARLGISVPRDLSIVGFDTMLGRLLTPPLTAVHRPVREIAQGGIARLIDVVEGVANERTFHPQITLTIGETSASPVCNGATDRE